MKKLLLSLSLSFLLSGCVFATTPIATKSLGVDSITGLDKQVQVWQLTIDAKAEKIVVVYDVVLLYNGKVVSVLSTDMYTRENRPAHTDMAGNTIDADNRFSQYRSSQLGQAIEAMIQQTINAYPNVQQ